MQQIPQLPERVYTDVSQARGFAVAWSIVFLFLIGEISSNHLEGSASNRFPYIWAAE
jgi:hypothetical protein